MTNEIMEILKKAGYKVDVKNVGINDTFYGKNNTIIPKLYISGMYDANFELPEGKDIFEMLGDISNEDAYKNIYVSEILNFEGFELKISAEKFNEIVIYDFLQLLDEQTQMDLIQNNFDVFIDENYVNSLCDDYFYHLMNWNTIFSGNFSMRDISNIHKAGLYAFIFEGECYISIGGCGMDRTPNLDYFQYLVTNSLPNNSTYYSQQRYFIDLIGIDNFKSMEKDISEGCYEEVNMYKWGE